MHVHRCVYAQGMSVQKGICTVCVSEQGSLLQRDAVAGWQSAHASCMHKARCCAVTYKGCPP